MTTTDRGAAAPERPLLQRLFGPIRVGLYQARLNGAWEDCDVRFQTPFSRWKDGRLQLGEAEYLQRMADGSVRSVLDGTRAYRGEVDDEAGTFTTPEGEVLPC